MNALSELERYRYRGSRYFEEKLYAAAREEAHLWLSMAERLVLPDEEASALNALGCISLESYEWDESIAYFQEALKRASQPATRGKIYKNLGLAYFHRDELTLAQAAYEEALKHSWAVRDERFRAQLHMDLSGVLKEVDLDEAIKYASEALSFFQGTGDTLREGRVRNNLGILFTRKREYEEAERNFAEAVRLLREMDDMKNLAYTFTEIGRLHYVKGDLTKGKEYCKKALETILSDVTVMDKGEIARLRYLYGLIFEAEGDLERAGGYLEKASRYFNEYRLIREGNEAREALERLREKQSRANGNTAITPSGEDIELRYLDIFLCLGDSLEAKDKYTRNHSERVASYAVRIARTLNFHKEEKDLLSKIGRVHDIGKILIAKEILQKPTSLTDDEFAVVKLHPVIGEMILKNTFFADEGISLVRHHHERYDGKGYPDGLSGAELPLLCSILSVADAYDAMTSERPYRAALFHSEALRELEEGSGTQFHPAVVDVFLRCFLL